MRLTHVRIKNFRAHSNTELPLTQLGCLIGENNAGKSSVLHAIQYVLEDKKLSAEDFRNPELPASVELRIEGIDEEDLRRVNETHRDRVREMLRDGVLTIVRTQEIDGKAESRYLKLGPSDPSWSQESLASTIKGKKGAQLRQAVVELLPPMEGALPAAPNQQQVKDAWTELVGQLPPEELEETPTAYPTGIAQSVKPLLPSVIYIEAVKDASVEAKSTGTSAFSKLLELLFDEVADHFSDINDQFRSVYQKLNRSLNDDGLEVDARLEAVQRIESTIEEFVRASFPGVSLRMDVPAPTLSMLLSGAELRVDDGHEGSISSKGDGLKRTVLFALLRAYASIRSTGLSDDTRSESPRPSYVLLFEEPELYLHPRAQRQLMAALGTFSNEHQVLVTTHSPGFFRPGTEGFARLQKTDDGVTAHPVDLTIGHRDAYQIVQHENNEAAFFAQRVVLVEGDSDTFTYPHLARLINQDWDDIDKNIMFVKIDGKGNINRYREFFSSFKIPIHVITDLDALVRGFEQLTRDAETRAAHSRLMGLISERISDNSESNSKTVRSITSRRNARELWSAAQSHLSNWRDAPSDNVARLLDETLSELFDAGNGDAKLNELANPSSEEIASARDTVISSLAEENVFVLRRGDLETYCRTDAGRDKVATAIEFCERITNLEALRELHAEYADDVVQELQGIFSKIYN
ncbi:MULTISPECIES: ATP-dependent nuclease [Micrococcus]|uniref:ATP-dependent nuclease n=1 Tax=Micrococcus luteus TaxID=1270 RepID=UPI0010AE69E0|nr:AAA family ATPase [Micrococcus luteus]MBN6767292.1 ATP-dependent endonuclease [Micrococcus luteus]MBN6827464.1 ATP-dependent endonuclease [Micrococcus luteus]MBN6846193.1 ATP-dependent endonuclease [Micrococcus luteus]MBN6861449.1 ATP-dependent endonuclease [Micrococcus luteus]MBN6863940.1 ATP-dependent endonuclease [Micrococcus luteus]